MMSSMCSYMFILNVITSSSGAVQQLRCWNLQWFLKLQSFFGFLGKDRLSLNGWLYKLVWKKCLQTKMLVVFWIYTFYKTRICIMFRPGCVISEPLPENRAKQTDHLTLEADPLGCDLGQKGWLQPEEWGYLLYPGVWTAPPVQAERPAGDDPLVL